MSCPIVRSLNKNSVASHNQRLRDIKMHAVVLNVTMAYLLDLLNHFMSHDQVLLKATG